MEAVVEVAGGEFSRINYPQNNNLTEQTVMKI